MDHYLPYAQDVHTHTHIYIYKHIWTTTCQIFRTTTGDRYTYKHTNPQTHRTHKSIWINKSSVNPKSTSNQSSKPCTVLQYPSRKDCYTYKHTNTRKYTHTYMDDYLPDIHCYHRWPLQNFHGQVFLSDNRTPVHMNSALASDRTRALLACSQRWEINRYIDVCKCDANHLYVYVYVWCTITCAYKQCFCFWSNSSIAYNFSALRDIETSYVCM